MQLFTSESWERNSNSAWSLRKECNSLPHIQYIMQDKQNCESCSIVKESI